MDSVSPTRILVIDEDLSLLEMLRHILSPGKYTLRSAKTATEGISITQENHLDVIVLDLLMKDLDSWDICHQIREFSQVPILVVSPISKPTIVAQALDAGADDFLLKPVPSSVLIANLNKLARRSKAKQEPRNSSDYPVVQNMGSASFITGDSN